MNKKAHETALPKRRFPEFRDAEAWDIRTLGSVAKLIKEKAGSKRYKLMSITSGAGLVSQMEKFGREIAGASYKNYYVIRKGDFAYNKSSTKLDPEGQIALLENEEAGAVPNSIFTCFRVNEHIVSPHFLKYPFANNLHGKWLRDLITVGARVNGALSIDSKHLLALPLALPSLPEQQKIAATLSSLDALLTAQTTKLTALQAHKRGLMQDLFPAEGETVPKRRFPEFQGAGEWVEKELKEVSPAIFDGTHQTPKYTEVGIPFFSVENVVSGKANKFISKGDYLLATSKNKPEKGDVLLTRIGKIGFSAIVNWDYEFSVYVTLAVLKQSEKFNSYYLHCYLQSTRYQNEILGRSLLNAAPCKINMDELRRTKVFLPPTLEEQQKIADCLSALDNLITAQTQKIDALKLHKKGLMQALFPAVSEPNA